MSLWTKLKYLLPSNRRAEERDMQEELSSIQELAGTRELGNLTLAAENARAVRTFAWLEHLAQDVRYALRSMMHAKAFTALAVLSLALGIGANTAIYSFMDSILLRPLPVRDPESLVIMKWRAKRFTSAARGFSNFTGGTFSDPQTGVTASIFPYPALRVFQDNTDVLSSAFCYFPADRLTVRVGDETEAIKGQFVSGNYFQGMNVSPAAGRLIFPEDDDVTTAAVAVLSQRFSQRRFGDPAAAVGQSIRIDGVPFTVIGGVPGGFFGAEPGWIPDVFVPMRAQVIIQQPASQASVLAQYENQNFYWIEIMGRLKAGVSLEQAQAVLAPQFARFAEGSVSTEKQREALPILAIQSGATGLDSLRYRYSKSLYVLMAMVMSILLIACANIANLLLARTSARRREIAVRLSIGASRLRLIRQLLTESVLLASLGGVLGIALAWWGISVLTLLLANGRENFTLHAGLNWNVLGVTLLLSVFTGLLFGLAPALRATRVDVMSSLKEVRVGFGERARSRFGFSRLMIVTQIAFSLLLLVAAGLFGRTLTNLHSIELGFNREDILLFTIRPRTAGYEGPALYSLYERLRERLTQIPGVNAVSLSSRPLPVGAGTAAPVTVSGIPLPDPDGNGRPQNIAALFTVGPRFFETMQIPVTQGRDFEVRDRAGAPRVAVVNQQLLKMLNSQDLLGRTLTVAMGQEIYEIVGVVQDARFFNMKDEFRPVVYFPYEQNTRWSGEMTFELRFSGRPLDHAGTVRQVVREVDSRLAVSDLKTQATHIDQAISQEIALARLCSIFAGLALVIACVGLYGTVSFNVARRTGEIGIRMALGAQRSRITWMVQREVLLLSIAGLAIGVPSALGGSRYIKSFLYGIQPNDPLSITLAVMILLLCGLIAGFVPAHRASKIDPMVAVRHE